MLRRRLRLTCGSHNGFLSGQDRPHGVVWVGAALAGKLFRDPLPNTYPLFQTH